MAAHMNVGAYDPLTGNLVWHVELPGWTNSGSLATAGDLVLQGLGDAGLYALDARTGRTLFTYDDANGIRASPITYRVNGKQYVAVVATTRIVVLALP
jgi:alcohol dehydrogenase (cytochrome c)